MYDMSVFHLFMKLYKYVYIFFLWNIFKNKQTGKTVLDDFIVNLWQHSAANKTKCF